MATWNETRPRPTDIPNADLASLVTSNKQAFREGIEKHSDWTDSSAVSAGIPRLSFGSFGPGACRAFYDTESNSSSAVSATKPLSGRLYITSNTSRLLGYSSGNSVIMGSGNMIAWQVSSATIPSNARVLVQTGSFSMASTSRTTTAFPSAYSVTPVMQLTPLSSGTTNLISAALVSSSTTNFAVTLGYGFGIQSPVTVLWRS